MPYGCKNCFSIHLFIKYNIISDSVLRIELRLENAYQPVECRQKDARAGLAYISGAKWLLLKISALTHLFLRKISPGFSA